MLSSNFKKYIKSKYINFDVIDKMNINIREWILRFIFFLFIFDSGNMKSQTLLLIKVCKLEGQLKILYM